MNRLYITVFLVLCVLMLHGQNLVVRSFGIAENDQTANSVGSFVMDQNGQRCALIKISTTPRGFSFDAGSLGVVKTEQHDGEVWVYVPEGVKRLTIMHQDFGTLRDYDLGMMLRRAKTYHLQLDAKIQRNLSDLVNLSDILVYPSDNWLSDNGLIDTIYNDGDKTYKRKYQVAYEQNKDMERSISAVQKMLTHRGFNIFDIVKATRDRKKRRDDADVDSFYLALIKNSSYDIRVKLDFNVNNHGSTKDVSFSLKAINKDTNDQLASVKGTVKNSKDPVDIVLSKLINSYADEFCRQLAIYFLDMQTNGRKILVVFRVAEYSGIDFLEDEVKGTGESYRENLVKCIQRHSVNKTGTLGRQTKHICELKNVRIPLYDGEGRPLNARKWAKKIREEVKKEIGFNVKIAPYSTFGKVILIVSWE